MLSYALTLLCYICLILHPDNNYLFTIIAEKFSLLIMNAGLFLVCFLFIKFLPLCLA